MAEKQRTQSERRALSERRLLEAAEQLIAEKGSSRTTLAEIGERAGYSRGLANQRFGSKRELVDALARRLQRRLFEETLLPALAGESGLAALLLIVDVCLGALETEGETARAFYVLMGESLGPVPEIRDMVAAANREFRAHVEREIKLGIEAHEIRPDIDVAAQTGLIVGALRGIVMQWLVDPDSVDLTSLRLELHRSLGRTLGVHPG
ncbi:MAG: TetR family transcriptional regulator [bacterium]|nr:TetR family transcriptional regulator [bacterium]